MHISVSHITGFSSAKETEGAHRLSCIHLSQYAALPATRSRSGLHIHWRNSVSVVVLVKHVCSHARRDTSACDCACAPVHCCVRGGSPPPACSDLLSHGLCSGRHEAATVQRRMIAFSILHSQDFPNLFTCTWETLSGSFVADFLERSDFISGVKGHCSN